MKWLLQTYTGRFNRRHGFFSHVFSGRYKAPLVDGSGNGYLRTVCEYVHLNPLKDLRLTQAQFELLPAGSRSKLALARRLRRETTPPRAGATGSFKVQQFNVCALNLPANTHRTVTHGNSR